MRFFDYFNLKCNRLSCVVVNTFHFCQCVSFVSSSRASLLNVVCLEAAFSLRQASVKPPQVLKKPAVNVTNG